MSIFQKFLLKHTKINTVRASGYNQHGEPVFEILEVASFDRIGKILFFFWRPKYKKISKITFKSVK